MIFMVNGRHVDNTTPAPKKEQNKNKKVHFPETLNHIEMQSFDRNRRSLRFK